MPEITLDGVPVLGQHPELPTGCEATALAMLLGWSGAGVSKEEVADRLPREPGPHLRDGVRVGGDPHRAFVGDPRDERGYGAFHGVVARALEEMRPGRALDLSGGVREDLFASLSAGSPVLAWCTLDLREPRESESWRDVLFSDRAIHWLSPEHCVLLVGCSPTEAVVHDPHTGRRERWPRKLFVRRWEQMGRQAVTVGG